jgi:hypothetical protein
MLNQELNFTSLRRFVLALTLRTGRSQLVDAQNAPKLPAGTFDTGDGYYDPTTRAICAYADGKVVRSPGKALICGEPTHPSSIVDRTQHSRARSRSADAKEVEWIVKHCRIGK